MRKAHTTDCKGLIALEGLTDDSSRPLSCRRSVASEDEE
jgi:hypothetical protein